ncbi:hypothetical protein AADG42_18725 [Ammonicoccus fulvus]|uniref:Uncharacterized protein n=1 Tax=Ammonicoccus fulvus TaxID=3138240 RepID=A0ABZ3FW15_9ACTN
MSRKALATLAILALSVSACSANPDANPTPGTSPSAQATGSEQTAAGQPSSEPAGHSLPVAEVFGEPAWSMQIPPSWEQMTPVVTAKRVIALDEAVVRAYDSQGTEVWATAWKPLAEEDRATGQPPVLRQVSPEVIAVIDTGKVEGEGLSTSTYSAMVTLINIGDGALIKEVTVDGSASDAPKLGAIGLGFALPDRTAVVVLPGGEVVEAPPAPSEARLVGAASVGENPIGLWETGSVSALSSFGGTGWSSSDSAPSAATVNSLVYGSDMDLLLLGRWNEPTTGQGKAGEVVFQLLDAASGSVLAKPECGPAVESQFVVSPDREWKVAGPLRLGPGNKVDCVGGGDGEKSVTFSAVTDQGRAFGAAGEGGADPLLVDSTPGQEPKTHALPEGADPPIGVMEGDLAIHWDTKSGIITANPVEG